ncbi:MAG: hypothetical protein Q9M09_05550 [Mariprofundaceae bacterium]|nr:hypothetical protein [Mariprofundaceae bacterium]
MFPTVTAALYVLLLAWIQSSTGLAVHLCITVLLLTYADGSTLFLLQAWRLLRWLLLPILLLHPLFTPGELLITGWPFTREGWVQGSWLTLHLTSLYLAAMLLNRLLSLQALQHIANHFSQGRYLTAIYIRLFPLVLIAVKTCVQQHGQVWRDNGHALRKIPVTLVALLQAMEGRSEQCALHAASHWQQPPSLQNFRIPQHRALRCALLLWLVMLVDFVVNNSGYALP